MYHRLRAALVREIEQAGENPDNYDVDAMISTAQVIHGQIVRDYNASIQDGAPVGITVEQLAAKYGRAEETIRTILKRHKKGTQDS